MVETLATSLSSTHSLPPANPTKVLNHKANSLLIPRAEQNSYRGFHRASDRAAARGTGLQAEYFNTAKLTGLKLTRTDPRINFNWGKGAPDPSIGANTFSVRWTGKVQPRYSEVYTFSTRSDDGIRLWVNGKQLINRWQKRDFSPPRGKIKLEAGRLYDIKLEYYENKGKASAQLFWSSSQQSRQIIPGNQLFANNPTADNPTAENPTPSITVSNTPTPTGGNTQIVGPLPNITLSRYTGGFSSPADIVNAQDGSNRLYVVEQIGQIRTVQNGVVAASPFLDIRDRVQSGGEEGLLSLAFPPDYANKRHFYVYYTNQSGNVVLSRFQLQAGVNAANPNSETILLTIPHPTYSNHNGGKLAFGPDGYLYVSVGDGGGGGDPNNNAQNPNSLLGKILRLDVESPGVTTYAIPSTNPFLTNTDPSNRYRDEIWALGLRNPWRISFDRQTGDLYIADVGQGQREEVNFQAAASTGGQNYGWKILEGTLPYSNGNSTGFTPPLLEYDRAQGVSVTGGYVYRGSEFQSLQGAYLYGDFGSGRIWGVRRTATGTLENKLLLDSTYAVSTFGEDEQGNLYIADYFTGDIYKVNAQ